MRKSTRDVEYWEDWMDRHRHEHNWEYWKFASHKTKLSSSAMTAWQNMWKPRTQSLWRPGKLILPSVTKGTLIIVTEKSKITSESEKKMIKEMLGDDWNIIFRESAAEERAQEVEANAPITPIVPQANVTPGNDNSVVEGEVEGSSLLIHPNIRESFLSGLPPKIRPYIRFTESGELDIEYLQEGLTTTGIKSEICDGLLQLGKSDTAIHVSEGAEYTASGKKYSLYEKGITLFTNSIHPEYTSDEDCYQCIINPNYPVDSKPETLFHELVHVLANEKGIDPYHNYEQISFWRGNEFVIKTGEDLNRDLDSLIQQFESEARSNYNQNLPNNH